MYSQVVGYLVSDCSPIGKANEAEAEEVAKVTIAYYKDSFVVDINTQIRM